MFLYFFLEKFICTPLFSSFLLHIGKVKSEWTQYLCIIQTFTGVNTGYLISLVQSSRVYKCVSENCRPSIGSQRQVNWIVLIDFCSKMWFPLFKNLNPKAVSVSVVKLLLPGVWRDAEAPLSSKSWSGREFLPYWARWEPRDSSVSFISHFFFLSQPGTITDFQLMCVTLKSKCIRLCFPLNSNSINIS